MISDTPSKQPGSVLSSLPETALTGFFNHLLSQQSWAMARLRRHAGKTVRMRLLPASIALVIRDDGSVATAGRGVQTNAILTPNPLAWLIPNDPAGRFIGAGQDAMLARELAEIFGALHWDVEEDLSRIVGDIAAHKLVSAASGALGWHRNAAETIARSWAEHWQQESPVLAQPEAVRAFFGEVEQLHGRVERLEQKIEQLLSKQ